MNIIETALGLKTRKQSKATETSINVDYPKQNECITSGMYTFRISAGSGLQQIEVSLNGGSWSPCRWANGNWWFDWQASQTGSRVLLARGETSTGEKVVSARRAFTVKR